MEKHSEKFAGEGIKVQFDIRYGDLLDTLKKMPRGTGEEKESRWNWIRNHERYNDFITDVYKMCKPKCYEEIVKRLGENKASKTLHDNKYNPDPGMASTERKEFDPKVLLEAVVLAVKGYTGENQQGKTYSFLQSVGINYNQLAEREAAINDAGPLETAIPKKDRCYVLRLVRAVNDIQEQTRGKKTLKDIILETAQDFSHKFTQKELEEVVRRVCDLDKIGSLDQPIGSEDDDDGVAREVPDPKNGIEDWEDENERRLFWKKFTEKFQVKWQEVTAGVKLEKRELYKYFLSKDILLLLKLYPVSDAERSRYKEYLEPKCGQWCYRRKNCPLDVPSVFRTALQDAPSSLKKSTSRKSCYVRYGIVPGDKRTGDEEIYGYLKSCQGSLYETIFNNEYVQYAYPDGVKSLDDMYIKLLKDFRAEDEDDRFEFTDAFMDKAGGIGKDKLSKSRRDYENIVKGQLYQIFVDEE